MQNISPSRIISMIAVGGMIAGLNVAGLFSILILDNWDGIFLILFAAAISILNQIGKSRS